MQKMQNSVTFFLPNLAGGGAEKVFLTLIAHFPHNRTYLTVLNKKGELLPNLPNRIRILDLEVNRGRNSIIPLIKFFRTHKPEIIVSNMAYFNFIIAFALKLSMHSPKRVIFREANTPSSTLDIFPFKGLGKLVYRWLYKSADCIICNSKQVREELVLIGIKDSLISLIPNPIDKEKLQKLASKKFELSENLDTSLPLFVCVGRLSKKKGIDALIRAVGRMTNQANLLIIGQGQEEDFLKTLAQKENLNNQIHFLGFKKNPFPFMKASTAVILPSRWEGLPNVGLEALALGKVVVATKDTGGLVDLSTTVPKTHLRLVNDYEELTTVLDHLAETHTKSDYDMELDLLPQRFNNVTVICNYKDIIFGK